MTTVQNASTNTKTKKLRSLHTHEATCRRKTLDKPHTGAYSKAKSSLMKGDDRGNNYRLAMACSCCGCIVTSRCELCSMQDNHCVKPPPQETTESNILTILTQHGVQTQTQVNKQMTWEGNKTQRGYDRS